MVRKQRGRIGILGAFRPRIALCVSVGALHEPQLVLLEMRSIRGDHVSLWRFSIGVGLLRCPFFRPTCV